MQVQPQFKFPSDPKTDMEIETSIGNAKTDKELMLAFQEKMEKKNKVLGKIDPDWLVQCSKISQVDKIFLKQELKRTMKEKLLASLMMGVFFFVLLAIGDLLLEESLEMLSSLRPLMYLKIFIGAFLVNMSIYIFEEFHYYRVFQKYKADFENMIYAFNILKQSKGL